MSNIRIPYCGAPPTMDAPGMDGLCPLNHAPAIISVFVCCFFILCTSGKSESANEKYMPCSATSIADWQ